MNNQSLTSSSLLSIETNESSLITTLLKVGKLIFDIGFVLLPSVGYIHQYLKIKRLKNATGFSKFVSFTLITAFVIRIFFWLGKNFELTVLINAIVGIVMQLILLELCVKYTPEYKDKSNSDFFAVRDFWNWPYFMDYFYFTAFLTIYLSLLSNAIGYDNELYIFVLGALTSLVESFLGVPQMIAIFRTKNVKTISYLLVFTWALGDAIKLAYYIITDIPIQLKLCCIGQLMIDFIIISQIYYYSQFSKKKNALTQEENKIIGNISKDVNIS